MNAEDSDELQVAVERAVRHVFKEQYSVKKNGSSWPDYFGKLMSVDRLLMLIVAAVTWAYVFGGEINDYRAFRTQAEEMKKREVKLQDQVEQMAEAATEQRYVIESLTKSAKDTEAFRQAFEDRLRLTVTRAEFQAAMRDIGPRLQRIEQAVR